MASDEYTSTSQDQHQSTNNQRDEERNDPTLEVRRFVSDAEYAQQATQTEEEAHPEAQAAIVLSRSIGRDVNHGLVLISGLLRLQQRLMRRYLVRGRLIHVRLVGRLNVVRRRGIYKLVLLIRVHSVVFDRDGAK